MYGGTGGAASAADDPIFRPLELPNLSLANRLIRSSISGRIDNYDGSGTLARINFEKKFARGGVAAIISSHVPVHPRGRVLPNYAMIDRDSRIPFWRELTNQLHDLGCKFILQLSYAGRQFDIRGIENAENVPLSATSRPDAFHGMRARAMTREEIRAVVELFAAGAVRARKAGVDGIELHSSNGYLFTQFLSSAVNDRTDEYGGSLRNRARFLLEVVEAIRRDVGSDFFLMVKLSARDRHNAGTFPLERRQGDSLAESIQVAQWVEEAGANAIHVSTGSSFPHPFNPAGPMPWQHAVAEYQSMIASGTRTFRNYLSFRYRLLRWAPTLMWQRTQHFVEKGRTIPERIEGTSARDAREIKQHVGIPIVCTGGFQSASRIREALEDGSCDAVSIARALLANPDLPQLFQRGDDGPAPSKRCTYCNKCLINILQHPPGCYEPARFAEHGERAYEKMIEEVLSIYADEVPSTRGLAEAEPPRGREAREAAGVSGRARTAGPQRA